MGVRLSPLPEDAIMRLVCSACCLAMLAMVLSCSRPAPPAAGGTHSGEPATPEEKIVADFLRAPKDLDGPVEFLAWGPHDLTGEVLHPRAENPPKIIRVRFR